MPKPIVIPGLDDSRSEAANRRSALRTAFIRHDPQLTGLIAPFHVADIIKSQRVDVDAEKAKKFVINGRFNWMLFCNALEKQVDAYFTNTTKDMAKAAAQNSPRGPGSPRGMHFVTPPQAISPRRLPALLRQGGGNSPRGAAAFLTQKPGAGNMMSQGSFSPRASVASLSGSMRGGSGAVPGGGAGYSPRASLKPSDAMREARLARVAAMNQSMSAQLMAAQNGLTALADPTLVAMAAKSNPSPRSFTDTGPPGSPRLMAAIEKVPPPNSPRAQAAIERAARERAPPSPRGPVAIEETYEAPVQQVSFMPQPPSEPAAPTRAPPKPVKKQPSKLKQQAIDQINSKFADIRKAFHYMDVNGSGKVGKGEIKRALHMWNIEVPGADIDAMLEECDEDGDGEISYNEFTDHLWRDTVAPEAMGKRGMLSKDAMGVDAFEMLDQQMGKNKVKTFKMPTFNDDDDDEQPAAAVAQAAAKPQSKAKAALLEAQGLSREERMAALDKAGTKDKRRKMKDQAMNQINSKFADIRKAFHYMDVNGSGKVGKGEIKRAMHMWNLDMADEDLELLLAECDEDGDGEISYNEFTDHLWRDTVAPAAMGKRGMLSKDAMGVDAFEMLDQQMGKNKVATFKYPGFTDEDDEPAAAPTSKVQIALKERKEKPGMSRADTLAMLDKAGTKDKRKKLKDSAINQVNAKFADIRKAFHYMDVNNSGKVGKNEIKRAMHMWNIDMSNEDLELLIAECDEDGDGEISYDEFTDHLWRDTVASAAMGKRGMLSKDAMGVDAFEMLDQQMGKNKAAAFKMPTFNYDE